MSACRTEPLQTRGPLVHLAVPCHFDGLLLGRLSRLSTTASTTREVAQTYGSLSWSVLGHGRSSRSVAQVSSLDEVRSFRDYANSVGISFNYLLNAPYVGERRAELAVRQYVEDVLSIVRPQAVTASSAPVMRMIREVDEAVSLYVSTIAGVRTPGDLEGFLEYKPTRVIPHHDVGRDFAALGNLKAGADRHGVLLELLLNESCLCGCSRRAAHYAHLASGESDDAFQGPCNAVKYRDPSQLLAASWIRPEDVDWYASRFGITWFKISGRAKPPSWLPEVVEAYVQGAYHGNLIRLLAITPPWSQKPWQDIYVSNDALDGLIQSLSDTRTAEQTAYYTGWEHLLRSRGALHVNCFAAEEASVTK